MGSLCPQPTLPGKPLANLCPLPCRLLFGSWRWQKLPHCQGGGKEPRIWPRAAVSEAAPQAPASPCFGLGAGKDDWVDEPELWCLGRGAPTTQVLPVCSYWEKNLRGGGRGSASPGLHSGEGSTRGSQCRPNLSNLGTAACLLRAPRARSATRPLPHTRSKG